MKYFTLFKNINSGKLLKYRYIFIFLYFISMILIFGIVTNIKIKGEVITDKLFKISSLSKEEKYTMIQKNCFDKNISPISINRLKKVSFIFFNFEGIKSKGEIIILDACAKRVLNIFKNLFSIKFPLKQCKPMYFYYGDDSKSMRDNNTSAHNCRHIINSKNISLHAYGTAIDINPVQNPYVQINYKKGIAYYKPIEGIKYANRKVLRLNKHIKKGMAEEVVEIFAKNGFYYWGGHWDFPIDYQHFQLSKSISKLLAQMDTIEAEIFFEITVIFFNKIKKPIEKEFIKILNDQFKINNFTLEQYYLKNKNNFWNILKIYLKNLDIYL